MKEASLSKAMIGRGSANMVKADKAVDTGVAAMGVTAASAQSRQSLAKTCSGQENFRPADCSAATVRAKSPLLEAKRLIKSWRGNSPFRMKTLDSLPIMKSAALSKLIIVGRAGASKMVRCADPEARGARAGGAGGTAGPEPEGCCTGDAGTGMVVWMYSNAPSISRPASAPEIVVSAKYGNILFSWENGLLNWALAAARPSSAAGGTSAAAMTTSSSVASGSAGAGGPSKPESVFLVAEPPLTSLREASSQPRRSAGFLLATRPRTTALTRGTPPILT